MTKFIIRNDDVAFDTTLEEIKQFSEICDKYGFQIIQSIISIGEARKITTSRLNNDQIRALSNRLFSENRAVIQYLRSRNDLIGIHGLWHTHAPTYDEIKAANALLTDWGFKPEYFVPPFNEGNYPDRFAGVKTCQLSMKGGDRLEDFLKTGVPEKEIMYLHSWRFVTGWYTFDDLDQCLKRLSEHYG
jgi:hypothetical protein